MEKLFDKTFTRRNFLVGSAKILSACSMFGMLPGVVRAEENKFKTLEELNIGEVHLEFGELELRPYTGAIIVHHYGLLRGDTDATVEEIHELHKNKNHWSGIGYHFVVHKDGSIDYARPLEYQGAHALANNEFTVGVAFAGNYQLGTPPKVQVDSAVQLLGAICHKYKFPATDTTILGHRDVGKTSCPGINLYRLLPDIIQETKKYLEAAT